MSSSFTTKTTTTTTTMPTTTTEISMNHQDRDERQEKEEKEQQEKESLPHQPKQSLDPTTSHSIESTWRAQQQQALLLSRSPGSGSGSESLHSSFASASSSSSSSNLASGIATPDPLLGKSAAIAAAAIASRATTSKRPSSMIDDDEAKNEVVVVVEMDDVHSTTTTGAGAGAATTCVKGYLGDPFENPSKDFTNTRNGDDGKLEFRRTMSHRNRRLTPVGSEGKKSFSQAVAVAVEKEEGGGGGGGGEEEEANGGPRKEQGVPPELSNLTAEIIFVSVCSAGQLLFAFFMGDVNVTQQSLKKALNLPQGEIPWLIGAFLTALGLSVILSGSLTDILPPKLLIVGAFVWLTIWNLVGVFTLTPSRAIAFFIVRAMQGFAVGVLVSGSMSILGRVYNPGQRKTRVFSAMAAASPFGFWLGALQGGALAERQQWIYGSNAIICGICAAAAYATIPSLKPAADHGSARVPSIRNFDWEGAICAVVGCICLLFGLTQGSVAHWSPYTYALIIVGVLVLSLFFWVETKVSRPLVPARLWKTPGFAPLMLAYFLGFGGFVGAWQFYAVQFFLNQQHVSSLTVALYLLPNAICGVLATWIVSKLMHRIPGHYIFFAAQVAFALGPAFFLPQTASSNYFALSMPGIGLATFGPDLSFAAASIYITSQVPRNYQGSAGSLLVTIQNLSGAIMTSVADSIAAKVDTQENGEVGLEGLRAAWWLALAAAVVGAVVTAVWVRIPKEEEKDHVA